MIEKEKSYCPNCFLPMKSNQIGTEHQNEKHAWLSHLSIEQYQNGAVAADKLINEIHQALGVVYQPGETEELLREHPDLAECYSCSKERKL